MTPDEFKAWKQWTEESQWIKDPIHDGSGSRDLLCHTGGESGKYVRFCRDGTVEVGSYDGAIPHIGEATFRVESQRRYEHRGDVMVAFLLASVGMTS